MSRKRKEPDFTEEQFENWFCNPINSFIPRNRKLERILVVGKHDPLHRDVDLLGIDAECGLVLIEVKNEKTTRAVVGQCLEYLTQYKPDLVDPKSLANTFEKLRGTSNRDLFGEFKDIFNTDLNSITERRRVIIAAPSFDAASSTCAELLNEKLGDDIQFTLVRVEALGSSGEFSVLELPLRGWTHPQRLLSGEFYEGSSGYIYYVLKAGNGDYPIVWKVGHKRRGEFDPLTSPGAKHVQKYKRLLTKIDQPAEVDTKYTGSKWKSTTGEFEAQVIGTFTDDGKAKSAKETKVVFVKFRSGDRAERNFSIKPLKDFETAYKREALPLRDWRDLVADE